MLTARYEEARLELGCRTGVGDALKEFCLYSVAVMSYENAARLIERLAGEKLLCDETIREIVKNEASSRSVGLRDWASEQTGAMPAVAEQVDVYSDEPEKTILLDGILATRQKNGRERRRTGPCDESEPVPAAKRQGSKATAGGRVATDVVMVEGADGTYRRFTDGIDEKGVRIVSVEEQARAFVIQEYGAAAADDDAKPLPFVAITDGAKAIRTQILAIFGHMITFILDWYHLCKRVREKMTMIARNKSEKRDHLRQLVVLLWNGQVAEAIEHLNNRIVCRNAAVRDELRAIW